jgi:hypothetical protein
LHMPINIGTEMNKRGLPFVDDLDGPALAPHKQAFLRGARLCVGHSVLLRFAGCGYGGKQAEAEFGRDRAARNAFFEAVGALPALTRRDADALREMGTEQAFAWFRERAGVTP